MNDLILALNEFEHLVLFGSGALSLIFIFIWYERTLSAWPFSRGGLVKLVLSILPIAAFSIIFYILKTAASHDVINDPFYILFYLALGFASLFIGVVIMSAFFDLSLYDDVLNMDNKAALFAFAGGFIGLTIIYAASNIGEGPGWACVVFTGGLGLISWVLIARIVNHFTDIFDRITIERNISCGIRVGSFLLATGIIMGEKLAGDWESVNMTLVDFIAAGPALASIIVELIFDGRGKQTVRTSLAPSRGAAGGGESNIWWSVLWGIALVATSAAGAFKIYG